MRKKLLGLMFIVGFSSASFAGGPPPVPGNIDCNTEHELCINGYEWEIDYKCEAPWIDNGTYVNIPGESFQLNAEEDGGYGDCRLGSSNTEGDDDTFKYEVSCRLGDGSKKGGAKVELEIKNKGPAVCPPL